MKTEDKKDMQKKLLRVFAPLWLPAFLSAVYNFVVDYKRGGYILQEFIKLVVTLIVGTKVLYFMDDRFEFFRTWRKNNIKSGT